MNQAIPSTNLMPTSAGEHSSNVSGVSWSAILAGAAGAAALSLILLVLGTGLGLSSLSPWTNQGAGAAMIGISTILWLTFTQVAASGMGGYLAGRLRVKWSAAHTDEVYFRDTAHGFLAWAVATLVTAGLLSSAVASVVGSGVQAGASLASGAMTTATAGAATAGVAAAKGSDAGSSDSGPMSYFVDSLFRKDASAAGAPTDASQPGNGGTASSGSAGASGSASSGSEVARIFANGIRTGSLAPEDARYVGQLIAQRTGIAPADAERRVADTFNKVQQQLKAAETAARDAADKARKASAAAAMWLFVSLLIGAFVASYAATLGGRRREA